MRRATLGLIIGCGLLSAQQRTPSIRSIKLEAISTTPKGLTSIEFEAIAAAWKSRNVNLTVENPLDVSSIDKAKEVIRELYGSNGHAVRVNHAVNAIPPRSLEVVFQVIELCQCN